MAEIEEVVEEKTVSPEIEEIAQQLGWSPQDNWRGDPDMWKPADEFILASRDIQDRKSSENRGLKRDLDSMRERMETIAANQTKAVLTAVKAERDRLQKQIDEAVESGDKEVVREATKKIAELEKDVPREVTQTPEEQIRRVWGPHAEDFEKRNIEALKSPVVRSTVRRLVSDLAMEGMDPEEAYAEVEKELKKDYPEYYTNPNREKPAKVSGNSRPASADKSKWGELVKELPGAEAQFMEFVESGVYKDTKEDRERYAKRALED